MPNAKAHPVEPADRPTACRDGVDLHHRRADADAGDDAFVRQLEMAGIVRDVSRSTAHVEADEVLGLMWLTRRDHANDTAGGTRENGVLPAECRCRGKPSVRLHEMKVGIVRKTCGDAID